VKIGSIELGEKPLFLAPMEDVSDLPFRKLCKRYGADMMYTEFVAADALIRNIPSSMSKTIIEDVERPVGIQLYGKDIEAMVEAAKIAETLKPDLIDINFGCPVKKIATKGAGSGMLRDVPKLIEMTSQIVKAVKLPVTVKTRLGWDESSKEIVMIAERLQDIGIQALTIHGRTRAQMYTGEADWTLIGEVKNNQRMHIPIIGNGDVVSPKIALERFDKYGVDGVMIGRGAIGRPWIFRETKHLLKTGEVLMPPSVDEQIDLLAAQVKETVAWIGERGGILHSRRHLATSFHGLNDFKSLKIQMLKASTLAELLVVFEEIKERYRGQFCLFE
jgi:tRNA-dihydrouridine synthase B